MATARPDLAWRFGQMRKLQGLALKREDIARLIRYGLVGAASNLAGYLVYLAVTTLGAPPKVTMTLLYGVGASVGYIGQRNVTFSHRGSMLGSGLRYLLAHSCGYALNLSLLIIFVDRMGYPHQWVQAVAIFVVAAFLFVAFKYFVFPDGGSKASSE
jgi:putative flippase GtrA